MLDRGVQRRGLFLFTLWGLIIAGTVFVLAVLGAGVLTSPLATMVSWLLALLYVLLCFLLFFRFPGFRWGVATIALLWGGSASVLLSMFGSSGWSGVFESVDLDVIAYSVIGAWPEELSKGLGIWLLFLLYCNRPWQGMMLGAFVGIGFETIENLMYAFVGGLFDTRSDLDGVLQMWMLRAIAGPWLHVMFSSLVGLGIGYLLTGSRKGLWWIAAGFGAHFAWNLQWDFTIASMIAVGVVLYPTVFWAFVQQIRHARNDNACYKC